MSDDGLMARPVRMPAELWARVDEVAGPRGAGRFVRAAVEAALSPVPAFSSDGGNAAEDAPPMRTVLQRQAAKVVPLKPAGGFTANAQRVLDLAGKYPHSERDLIRVLGWPMGDVKAAIVELEAAGKLRWSRGMVEAV